VLFSTQAHGKNMPMVIITLFLCMFRNRNVQRI